VIIPIKQDEKGVSRIRDTPSIIEKSLISRFS